MVLHPHLSILHKVLHCIQDFLCTGELKITERNGIEGIVLEGDDDRAVVVRRGDLETGFSAAGVQGSG